MVAFGKTAEAITNYVAKGSKVTVRARVKTGSYENKEGRKIYTTDFIVDEIEFPSKKESQASGNSFEPQDEDIFTPVDNPDDIPF